MGSRVSPALPVGHPHGCLRATHPTVIFIVQKQLQDLDLQFFHHWGWDGRKTGGPQQGPALQLPAVGGGIGLGGAPPPGTLSPAWAQSLPGAPKYTCAHIRQPTQAQAGLTFDAFLESLAAPLIGAPPQPLLSGLILYILAIFTLGRDRAGGTEGLAHHPQPWARDEEGDNLQSAPLRHPRQALSLTLAPPGLPTSLPERWGHQVVGMSSCRPASSTRSGLLM